MQIAGNTILITGGSAGIGQALATALHEKGNQVIIAGRNEEALKSTALAHPGMAYAVVDVTSEVELKSFASRTIQTYPTLNVLINNAGIMIAEDVTAPTFTTDIAEITINTNLLAPIRLTAAFLPHFKTQKHAAILNVSSGLAFVPLAATPTYSATKAALHSYSQSLRHQLRNTPISVVEIAPPAVATDLMPGHRENPRSMPLANYIAETMELLAHIPAHAEILVERVKALRHAEASGNYAAVFNMLNPA